MSQLAYLDWWVKQTGQSPAEAAAQYSNAELLEELHVFLRNRLSSLDQARQSLQRSGGLDMNERAQAALQQVVSQAREIQAFLGGVDPKAAEENLIEELRKEFEAKLTGGKPSGLAKRP